MSIKIKDDDALHSVALGEQADLARVPFPSGGTRRYDVAQVVMRDGKIEREIRSTGMRIRASSRVVLG